MILNPFYKIVRTANVELSCFFTPDYVGVKFHPKMMIYEKRPTKIAGLFHFVGMTRFPAFDPSSLCGINFSYDHTDNMRTSDPTPPPAIGGIL